MAAAPALPPAASAAKASTAAASSSRARSLRLQGDIAVTAVGSGGLEDLRLHVNEETVSWALLRFEVGSGAFRRAKLIAVHFNGDGTPAVLRGRLNSRTQEVLCSMGATHATVEVKAPGELTLEGLCLRLLPLFCADDGEISVTDLVAAYAAGDPAAASAAVAPSQSLSLSPTARSDREAARRPSSSNVAFGARISLAEERVSAPSSSGAASAMEVSPPVSPTCASEGASKGTAGAAALATASAAVASAADVGCGAAPTPARAAASAALPSTTPEAAAAAAPSEELRAVQTPAPLVPVPLPTATRPGATRGALLRAVAGGEAEDWLLLQAGDLSLFAAGQGGFEAMKSNLASDQVLYGLVRLAFGGGSQTSAAAAGGDSPVAGDRAIVKHVFIHWAGPTVPTVRRGRLNAQAGEARALVAGSCSVALTRTAQGLDDLDLADVITELRRLAVVDGQASTSQVSSAISVEAYRRASMQAAQWRRDSRAGSDGSLRRDRCLSTGRGARLPSESSVASAASDAAPAAADTATCVAGPSEARAVLSPPAPAEAAASPSEQSAPAARTAVAAASAENSCETSPAADDVGSSDAGDGVCSASGEEEVEAARPLQAQRSLPSVAEAVAVVSADAGAWNWALFSASAPSVGSSSSLSVCSTASSGSCAEAVAGVQRERSRSFRGIAACGRPGGA